MFLSSFGFSLTHKHTNPRTIKQIKTDGLANVGVGSLEKEEEEKDTNLALSFQEEDEDEEKEGEEKKQGGGFYREMSRKAKEEGVCILFVLPLFCFLIASNKTNPKNGLNCLIFDSRFN